MKQSFKIPEGCTGVTIEQVGNQIILTFEPIQPNFKRGDVIIGKSGSVCVVDEIKGDHIYEIVGVLPSGKITFRNRIPFIVVDPSRLATPEEAQRLWDELAKEGKLWNPETMQVENIKKDRWRATPGDYYYVPFSLYGYNIAVEKNDFYDDFRHKNGFYCQTEDQSIRLFDKLKQAADKFWEEELK